MKKSPIIYFVLAATVTLFVTLFASSYFLSVSFIEKEHRRSEMFLRQIQSSFDTEYRKIAEEFYVGSFDAIHLRLQAVGAYLNSDRLDFAILDNKGNCLYAANTQELEPGSCLKWKTPDNIRPEDLTPLSFHPVLNYIPGAQRYVYFVSVFIGSEHLGYLHAQLDDPYGFNRSSLIDFIFENFLIPIFLSLFVFALFLFFYWNRKLAPYFRENALLDQKIALSKLAARMAHDIQAPLQSLHGLIERTQSLLPDRDKQLLKNVASRIKSLSSELLLQNRNPEAVEANFCFVYETITSIVSEKEVITDKSHISIRTNIPDDLCSLGLQISHTALSRALSNILNNAIDATLEKANAKIEINLLHPDLNEGLACIQVIDNGKGMDSITLNRVLTVGGTYNKSNGNGIGLSDAREMLVAVGGRLNMTSSIGQGTIVELFVPKAPRPTWLLDRIELSDSEKVVIIEDDRSFGSYFKDLLREFECTVLTDPSEFYIDQYPPSQYTYFVDLEYQGSTTTGIDIIRSYALGKKAILTTSYFYDPECQKAISDLGAKILPKFLISKMEIARAQEKPPTSAEPKTLVLIDDDELVHQSWKIVAEDMQLKLKCYYTIEEFEKTPEPLSTPIYFDNNFAGVERGIEVLTRLWELGYRNLSMVTGSPQKFPLNTLPFPAKVLGKEFPIS